MIGHFFDNLLGIIAPERALRNSIRRGERAIVLKSNHSSMDKMFGRNTGPYEAGKVNRTNRRHSGLQITENDADRENVNNTRGRSWNQFRNNPQARKIVRTLHSKVIGKKITPQSKATLPDGTAHLAFRKRAQRLWDDINTELDYRGKPGRGGQTIVGLHKTAFAAALLSGGVLFRFRRLSPLEQRQKRTTIPLQLQLIHRDRLDESKLDASTFYGIEVNDDNVRQAYHILERHPLDQRGTVTTKSTRVKANFPGGVRCQVGHLYLEDDIDQLDGTPWMVAGMPRATIRNDYEIAEADAAEACASIAMGYRRSSGQSKLGLQMPNATSDQLTDPAGNPITHFQRKMLVDLGQDGDLVSFNPQRPNANAAEFISHLVRSEAVSVPGVKGSTLTGDYRRSSFSSERAADNDAWPELEQLQEWFFPSFSQVIYEEVVITAIEAGYFDDVEGFTIGDFNARQKGYLSTAWQGPVPRSINPKDDALASRGRVKNGQSSPQLEAAAVGNDLLTILDHFAEVVKECEARNLPEEVCMQLLGIDVAAAADTDDDEESQDNRARAAAAAADLEPWEEDTVIMGASS